MFAFEVRNRGSQITEGRGPCLLPEAFHACAPVRGPVFGSLPCALAELQENPDYQWLALRESSTPVRYSGKIVVRSGTIRA